MINSKTKKKLLSMGIILLMGLTFLSPIKAYASTYGWVSMNGSQNLGDTLGMAIDGQDNVYVADRTNNKVLKFIKASNTWEDITGTQSIFQPSYVAVDSSGNVYVADGNGLAKIWKLSSSTGTWTDITYSANLWYINGICVDNSGNVYMTTDQSPHILKLPNGSTSWVSIDGTNSFSNSLCGICTDSLGNVYVADRGGKKIGKLPSGSSTWVDITYSGVFNSPIGISIDGNNNLYVADNGNGAVKVLNNGSNTWTDATTNALGGIWGAAVDSSGNLYSTNDYPGHWGLYKWSILAETASAANNSVSLNSSNITAGNPVTLTAVGDRQSATGSLVGDERYIPTTWTSDETGKSGTFALNSGNYTSNYAPSTAGSYTITATFQKQTWDGTQWNDVLGSTDEKTTSLTVDAPQPTPASRYVNRFDLSSYNIAEGSSTIITAVGDRQSAIGSVVGDQRYIPTTWISDETGKSGTFTLSGGSYTGTYTSSTTGSYTITVTYQSQRWDGTQWVDEPGVTGTKTDYLEVYKGTNINNNNVSLSSNSVTVGNSVTITATGDRQSAIGSLEGDERYIPTTWTSDETGKSGTFALNSGNYTSDYNSSTSGSYTITVTFQSQVWGSDEGGNWQWYDNSGVTDTKTTILSVNAAGVTPPPVVDPPVVNNETTPAAVTIQGTKRVGETLTAELKDEAGNNFTTSAAVTYEWYRLDNEDSEFIDQIGTGRNYRLTGYEYNKYIGVRAIYGDYSFDYVIGRISAASSSSSHHHHSTTTDTATNTETKKNDNIKKTGWSDNTANNTKSYINEDGTKAIGWKLIDNKWYFFNKNTKDMVTGWYKSEVGDWTFDKNDTAGQWFHLDSDGKLTVGWLKDTDNNWYYLCSGNAYGALGVMLTGWQKIDGNWYYFNTNGVMASNAVVDGYTIGANGAWIE